MSATPTAELTVVRDHVPAAAILIVDDHDANLLALEAVLGSLGHRLVRARSGEEALRHLLEQEFAVILLDVMMPGIGGLETAAMVRDRERTRTTPIIFLTAMNASPRDVIRGYAHGAVDYMVKPFDPDILRAKVEVFVELHRSREENRRQAAVLREREREREALLRSLIESRTARAHAEDSLATYRFLAESIPQQVWTATPDGLLDYVNSVVTTYFAQTAEQVLGAGWQAVIHPDDLAACLAKWTTSLATGDPYEVEFRLRRHDGAYLWHLARAIPERDPVGRIVRWFGTNTDVDAQRAAIRSRDDLLATVSHDLRGPLGSITLAVDVLRLEITGGAKQLGAIERAADRMTKLIQDLLDMASIEAGHLSVEPTRVSVRDLVDEAVDAIQLQANAKRVAVRTELDPAAVAIHCDRGRVLQVFANILGNAVKFTPAAGTITVRTEVRDQLVQVAITDTGPGITPQELPFVFDRFWQAKETARAGTGLGLAIGKGIIQQHGGAIWVESERGVGTTFYFTLPIDHTPPG